MPSGISRRPIAGTLDALLESQTCKIGFNNLLKFRRRYTTAATRTAFTIPITEADCYVIVRIYRACVSDANFAYQVVDEVTVYRYTSGVGVAEGFATPYTFSGGLGAELTQADTITSTLLTTAYTNPGPGTAYLAGYVWYQVIPNFLSNPQVRQPRYDNSPGAVQDGFTYEALSVQPYNLYPYRRHIKTIDILLPATNYNITDPITFDAVNGKTSVMMVKLIITIVELSNPSNTSVLAYNYTAQTGSITVPPYSVIHRNTTQVATIPTGILINPMGLTITTVDTTGDVNTTPSFLFHGSVTTLPSPARCTTKLEVVCAAEDLVNYS